LDAWSVRDGKTREVKLKKGRREEDVRGKPGKESMKLFSEKQTCPRRWKPTTANKKLKPRPNRDNFESYPVPMMCFALR